MYHANAKSIHTQERRVESGEVGEFSPDDEWWGKCKQVPKILSEVGAFREEIPPLPFSK